MSNPLVSVIIAVKNGEQYLAQAVESVLAQDYRPWELVVIDGHSTDRTELIARSYPDVLFVEQEKDGIPDAWNQGIQQARGPLLAFLSADDYWAPGKLTQQVDHLQNHPEILYGVACFRYFVEPGFSLPPGFNPDLLGRDLVGFIMETLVARREVFQRVGVFNTAYRIAEDVDWFARAKDMQVPMAVLPAVLLHKRIHDRNASSAAAVNTPNLLRILRQSIHRQAAHQAADDASQGEAHA
jgi:glycosyltransferase involved in cell wall biosynthesis